MTSHSPDKPLAGRIAFVTGASRGIGRSTALALAKAGAHVIAAGRTQGALEELDDEIKAATGESATLTPFDVTDGDGIDRLGGALWERFKRVDVLVHSAGRAGTITPVSHMEPKDFDAVIATNLTSTYRLIRSFEPLLRASDAGRAILLSSGVAGEDLSVLRRLFRVEGRAGGAGALLGGGDRHHAGARRHRQPGPDADEDARGGVSRGGPDDVTASR